MKLTEANLAPVNADEAMKAIQRGILVTPAKIAYVLPRSFEALRELLKGK